MIVRDYFWEFRGGCQLYKMVFWIYLVIDLWFTSPKVNFWAGVPIVFAMISALCHVVSMPTMMYLVPFSHKDRENYIQKMLYAEVGIPMVIALFWDLIIGLAGKLTLYAFIIQLVSIFTLTYIGGALEDRGKKKAAYKDITIFSAIARLISYIGGIVFLYICVDSISTMEFCVVLGIWLFVFGPILWGVKRRWKKIRADFADYEIATTEEVQNADYY